MIVAVQTNTFGRYALLLQPGQPITRLEFDDRADRHIGVVEGLSARGGDSHIINKVLFDRRGPKTFQSIVEQIMIYDRLRIIAEFGPSSPLHQVQNAAQLSFHQRAIQEQLRKEYGDRILSIPHPLRQSWAAHPLLNVLQEVDQRKVAGELMGWQRNVVDRLMGDLLFRYGYTRNPIHEAGFEVIQQRQQFPPPQQFAPVPAPAPFP